MLTGTRSDACRPLEGGAAAIAATLEEDIVLGLLPPKVRLVEDELMGRFEAKRHHIREALALLETLGLVERKRNIGAQVKGFSREEVVQLYEMRELLEVQAMRKIPLPLPTQAVQVLLHIQNAHDLAVQQRDARRIFRTNQEFHRQLFAQCGNAFLAQCIEDFARKTHAIRFGALVASERQLQSQQEHHALLQALQDSDRQRLLELTMQHLVPSKEHYLKEQEMLQASMQQQSI